jgi:hypothetical protein
MKYSNPLTVRNVISSLFLGGMVLISIPARADAHALQKPPASLTVVELFTSEGCNSCPPADEYLNRLVARPDILALSWFVDYWNYLGWTDTFGKRDYTNRQRQYNHKLGLVGVYTPQIIVDGVTQDIGSHFKEIDTKIARQQYARQNETALNIPIALNAAGQNVEFSLPAHDLPQAATLWLIGYKARTQVAIRGGELKGVTMHYSNVVTYMHKVGEWAGKAQNYKLGAGDITATGADHYAVLLQYDGVGQIIGAGFAPLETPENK